MRSGGTAESIAALLTSEGTPVSRATVGRRMTELKALRRAAQAEALRGPRSSPSPGAAEGSPPLPPTPDAIPEGTDLATLDRWLEKAERMGQLAEEDGDLQALAAAGRLSASLLEAKRKATPPMRPDPNENPDMIAAAARARALLHRYLDQALGTAAET